MLTHKLDRKAPACVVTGLRIYTVAVTVAFVLQSQYQRTNTMCEKQQRGMVFFFQLFELFNFLCLFASRF